METTANEHRKFELNALRYRQPVQFPEQWRYVLVLPFEVDQPSSRVQNRLKSRHQRLCSSAVAYGLSNGAIFNDLEPGFQGHAIL